MSINREANYLIEIIEYLLNGQKEELSKPDNSLDWDALLNLAKKHRVLNLVYYGIEAMRPEEKPDDDKVMLLYKAAMQEIVMNTNQMEAANELLESFERAGIDVLAVKGICTKKRYPQDYLRTMSDIDLLYKATQHDKIKSMFAGLGYDQSEEGRKHDSYFRYPYINIEMHRSLIAIDSQYGEYFANIWERVKHKNGYSHVYEMTLEDEYLYTILHLVEHFINGGIGIRFIMDVYIYNRIEMFDWGYFTGELKTLGLYEFYVNISKLAEEWFGKSSNDKMEPAIEELAQFIVANGVFGNAENAAAVSVTKKGRLGYLLRTVFPNLENMKSMFPWLEKWPILLPVSWCIRGIRSILYRRKNIRIQLNKVKYGSKEHGVKLQEFYRKCGL